MADEVSTVKTAEVFRTSESEPADLNKEERRIFSSYRDYVSARAGSSEQEFKKRRKTIVYTVRRIEPSLLPELTAYVGTAIVYTGIEIDFPPREFNQAAFLRGPTGTMYLNIFGGAKGDGAYSDVPFCSQRYIETVCKSVDMQASQAERAKANEEMTELIGTDCRSLLPELRDRLRFEKGLDAGNGKRLKEMAAFLYFLLAEHDSLGHYSPQKIYTKFVWIDGKSSLPPPAGWMFHPKFVPGSMTPYAARAVNGGFEAKGFALLDGNTLVDVSLFISPTDFSFREAPHGQLQYGP